MKYHHRFAACAGILLSAGPLGAQTVIAIPSTDGTGVSGHVQHDAGYADNNTQWHVKNSGNQGSTTRKGYVRIDTTAILGPVTDASFDLTVSREDIGNDNNVQTIHVFGLNDGIEDNWNPDTMTWADAPGNDTESAHLADLTEATLLGTFTYQGTEGVNIVKSFSDQTLIDFLNADTNGQVTFIVGRTGVQGSNNLLFAGDTNGTLDPPTLNVTFGADMTAPLLVGTNPVDDALEVQPDDLLVATFNESIVAGTGNITLHLASNDSVVETFNAATSTQLDFTGSDLTITPSSLLTSGVEYYVLIPDTSVQDGSGNFYAGLSDPTAWSFTGDALPPSVAGLSPADDSPGADAGGNIVATFSEDVFAGSGDILIKDLTNATTETIDILDARVSFVGNTLTIDPTSLLLRETDYAIQIGSGAIEDFLGNAFTGITDDTTWNFTTAPIAVVNATGGQLGDTDGQGNPQDFENTPFTTSFDAGVEADKLVVAYASEGGGNAPITYDGNALTRIPNTFPGGHNRGIYYLDLGTTAYAGGPADLIIDMSASTVVNGLGYGVVSIVGASPGYALTASAANSGSVTVTPPINQSLVVVNYGANGGGSVSPGAALTTLYSGDIGSAAGATGYENFVSATAQTYAFSDAAPGAPGTSAAVFVPASGTPAIVGTDPADGTLEFPRDGNLVATFSEDIVAGTGNVELWQVGGGSPVESFNVASSGQITVSGNTLTIDPTSDFPSATLEYYVLIDAGAVVDNTGGNAFGGLTDPAFWSFSTYGPPATDNDRVSVFSATAAGETVTTSDLAHGFDTFSRVSTAHTAVTPRDIALSAGHHLVIYNARFDDPDDADGNRSEIQTNLNLNGTDLPAGWSQGYIRRITDQHETICAGGAIINVEVAGDLLQLQSFKTGTANEDVIREPGQTAIQLVKLDDSWDYLRLAGHDGLGTDQSLDPGDTTVAYTDELEKDAGSFGDTSDGVTLVQAGHYLVLANTYVVGDNAGSAKRTTVSQSLTLDGAPVLGSTTTVYLRGAAGEDEGAATIGMIIETTAANQVLRTLVNRENEAVGTVIDGDRTSITIAKLPDTANFIRLTDSGNLQDFNGGTLTYDTQAELDAPFTHDTGTNPDQIGVTTAGDYLFFASQYNGAGVTERINYNQGWQINGSGGLSTHGQTGAYNRVAADASGPSSVAGNWSGFVTGLSASDYVQTVTQALGVTGSEVADDFALQGVSLTSLFGGTPATAYDTWAATNGLSGGDAATDADTESGGGDGLVQLLEFGFGTDPNVYDNTPLAADGSVFGTPILAPATGGGFDLLFVRRDDHGTSGSVTYTPQFSSGDLETFYDDATTPTVVFDGAGYDIVSVPFPATLPDTEPARFGQVKVELAP